MNKEEYGKFQQGQLASPMKPMKFITNKTLKLITEPDEAWKDKMLLLKEP